jgi:L-lactate utilization protein LutB
MDAIKEVWFKERMNGTVEKLKTHGFKAMYVEKRDDAVKEILKHVVSGTTVGTGGSVTIRELGIIDQLEARGNTVYDHWKSGLSAEKILEIRKSQMRSDLFLGSVNALTVTGELVNIDASGNRTNSSTFGPGKVILVAGYNKVVDTIDDAIKRVKNIAAPMNARRLRVDVPCAKLGRCVDCDSPNRMCRVVVIHERKPSLTDILVILVGEELGY